MQPLTAAPRDGLTGDQVESLLGSPTTVWSAGAELWQTTGGVEAVEDISENLIGGQVTWDATGDDQVDDTGQPTDAAGVVYRSCQIQIDTPLAWGRDQVLIHVTGHDPVSGLTARFNQGLFRLSTPQNVIDGEGVYDVAGEDTSMLLLAPITDAVSLDAGSEYLGNVESLITSVDPAATVSLDPTAAGKTLPDDKVYLLTEEDQPTWLRIVNEQLTAIGYRRIWVNENGVYRSKPTVDPAVRPVEWVFDSGDTNNGTVGPSRTLEEDVWTAYNAWKFIASGLTFTPEEGNGMYTPPDNVDDGPTSIDAIGRRNQHTVFLDAADQESLVTQGDAIIAADRRRLATLTYSCYPLPITGQDDIVKFTDPQLGTLKTLTRRWVLDLGGDGHPMSDMQITARLV